ncbi:MAG: hypothetical protein MJ249_01820 [Kiritimatiellae bacterium]|nr:hypothetical protein [Kiritimatiellia bacterium]
MKKFFKILGVCVGLLAMFFAVYIYLGSLDAEHPEMPDLDRGGDSVSDSDNWYVTVVATRKLVSLSEEDRELVRAAGWACLEPGWWKSLKNATEAKSLKKLDAILARQAELFVRLTAEKHRTSWRFVQPEDAKVEVEYYDQDSLLALFLLELKVLRAFQQGEYMFAFNDLQVYDAFSLAFLRAAGDVSRLNSLLGLRRFVLRRVRDNISQLDKEQLMLLQQMLDREDELFPQFFPQAFAREVAGAEKRIRHYFFNYAKPWRCGFQQMLEPVAQRLNLSAMFLADLMLRLPRVDSFSFHFNRHLSAYYETVAKTHSYLVRGRYDASVRLLRPRWNLQQLASRPLPITPNWCGKLHRYMAVDVDTEKLKTAAQARFELATERLVVAAARYRLDHSAYPARLEDLVPDYLAAVPKDPFGEGESPLGFNASQLTIHSVGENGCFDGVIPPEGISALRENDENGHTRSSVPYLRRLDGTSVLTPRP